MLGVVLMAVAIAWLAASRFTIPEGYSGSFFGPRAFPNALGFLLLLLSVILVAQTFSKKTVDDDEEEEEANGDMAPSNVKAGSEAIDCMKAISLAACSWTLLCGMLYTAGPACCAADKMPSLRP